MPIRNLNRRGSALRRPLVSNDLRTDEIPATGGHFSSPTMTEIAEDGDPEYVIPVKKESIALPLLRQLFGELSDSARETLREGFGTKERADALSGLPDLLSSAPAAAAPVVNQNNNQSV